MSQDLDELDPTFTDDLYISRIAVYTAVHWLNNRQHTVVCPPNKERPEAKDRAGFTDFGDLQVALGRDGLRHLADFNALETVEVKQRFTSEKYPDKSMDFHSVEEFPWPTVLVGIKKHYDKLDPEPIFTICFNETLTGCLIIKKDTRLSAPWTVWKGHVKKNGRIQTCYEVPKHLTTYYEVKL
jgi:hypothetical protein